MLKKLAKDLLFPFYDEFQLFFKNIFRVKDQFGIVVFIARRCSNLAEIFFQLQKKSAAEKFPSNFVTDSALLSMAPLLAGFYRQWGYFPPILIVDDIVIYGRSLNTLLESLEDDICAELGADEYSRKEIVSALTQALKIRTYACNNQPLLLRSRYQPVFSAAKVMAPVEWRDLSNRISRLILIRGEVNSCFTNGAVLSTELKDDTALLNADFSRIKTVYDAFSQTMFCRTLPLPNGEMIIYTVRTFFSSVDDAIVAAPFVFFPDMEEEDIDRIFRSARKMCGPQPAAACLDSLYSMNQRTKAEALALLLSSSLLREFFRLANIPFKLIGRIKLEMNFGTAYSSPARQFVDFVLDQKADLLSIQQMDYLLAGSAGYRFGGLCASPAIQAHGNERMKERIEDALYNIGTDHYADAYWQTQMYQNTSYVETKDYFSTAFELIEQFHEAGYSENSVPHVVSWVFQMADAGILAIIMRTNSKDFGRYVGQCVKTGEQSQFIMPKRLRDFIPILSYIEKKAYALNHDFCDELNQFSDVNQDVDDHIHQIYQFLMALDGSGQKLSDWNFDLVTLPDSHSPDWTKSMKEALRSIRFQQKMMEDYDHFVQTEQS